MNKGRRLGLVAVILLIIVSGFAGYTVRTNGMTDKYNTALQLHEATDPKKLWNLPVLDIRRSRSTEDSEEDNSASSQSAIVPSVNYITCPSCGGAGRFTCGICGGTGQQYIPNLYYDAVMGWTGGYQGCGGCGGSGGTVCSTCGGTGQVIG